LAGSYAFGCATNGRGSLRIVEGEENVLEISLKIGDVRDVPLLIPDSSPEVGPLLVYNYSRTDSVQCSSDESLSKRYKVTARLAVYIDTM
jgi:hypothetical protein